MYDFIPIYEVCSFERVNFRTQVYWKQTFSYLFRILYSKPEWENKSEKLRIWTTFKEVITRFYYKINKNV